MVWVDGNQITFSTGTVAQKTLPTADALKLDEDPGNDENGDDDTVVKIEKTVHKQWFGQNDNLQCGKLPHIL